MRTLSQRNDMLQRDLDLERKRGADLQRAETESAANRTLVEQLRKEITSLKETLAASERKVSQAEAHVASANAAKAESEYKV